MLNENMVQSQDTTSNTFEAPNKALKDEFWQEVELYNARLEAVKNAPKAPHLN